MKLEEHVTSLEISNKLKELGFKQESLFYWDTYSKELYYSVDKYKTSNVSSSAYTASELGCLLPEMLIVSKSKHSGSNRILRLHCLKAVIGKDENGNLLALGWKCFYAINAWNEFATLSYRQPWVEFCFSAVTEVEARAKMLIYLKESRLI